MIMHLGKKGQVGFEILLITAIVFMVVIWISGYYLSIKDSTLAMQLAKVHTIKQISKSEGLYTIQKIDFEENSPTDCLVGVECITLKINVPETGFGCNNLESTELANLVRGNTKYSIVNIVLNGTSC